MNDHRHFFSSQRSTHRLSARSVETGRTVNARKFSRTVIFLLLLAAGLSACVVLPNKTDGVCGWFDGYCFDAYVNGEPVIPLQSEDVIRPFLDASHYVRDVKWQLAKPITGPISVRAVVNEAGLAKLGARGTLQAQVVPLGDYRLASRRVISKSDNVRIAGQAATVASNVLQSNVLPPGNYLLRITARGDSWDRKTVFVIVR